MTDGRRETLETPAWVREAVSARDQDHCRFCGRTDGILVMHHCLFGGDYVGMGGRRIHHPELVITLGGAFDHNCHAAVHENKRLWLPLSLAVVEHAGVTMLQLMRWRQRPRRLSDLVGTVPIPVS